MLHFATRKPRTFDIIVATSKNNGIGFNGNLPWKLPKDMKNFTELTSKTVNTQKRNTVIMGRKTYESIPKPLQFRKNIILSRQFNFPYVTKCSSLNQALNVAHNDDEIEKVFVIGGSQIYLEALKDPRLEYVYKTQINEDVKSDTFFPKLRFNDFSLVTQSELYKQKNLSFTFNKYKRINTDEIQYLNLAQNVLDNGLEKNDRTGTGVLSTFGNQLKFDIRHHLPVLTTKKVHLDAVAKELLWFISGKTNTKILFDQGVGIWNGNSTYDFNYKQGFPDRIEGDLGPLYGMQWRHCGAKYIDCNTDYTGKGVDQIQNVIDSIKTNPNDRGHIISAWNVTDIPKMNLRPCHPFIQFYIDPINKELSCNFYQRSSDLFLGAPFNIASYGMLTYILACLTDLNPGYLTMSLGDTHIYKNHVEQFKMQLKRKPRKFPEFEINPRITSDSVIDDITLDDLVVYNYNPHEAIIAPMAI